MIGLIGGGAVFFFTGASGRVSLAVRLDKDAYSRGDTVEMNIEVKHESGPASGRAFLSTKVISPENEYILQALFFDLSEKSTKYRRLEFAIPKNELPGRYLVISRLKVLRDDDELVDMVQKETSIFVDMSRLKGTRGASAKSVRKSGSGKRSTEGLYVNIYLDDVLGKFSFDEKIDLGGSVKNISDVSGNVKVSMAISSDEHKVKSFSKTIPLLSKESRRFEFVYDPDKKLSSGKYNARFEVHYGKRLIERKELIFFIYDRNPEVSFRKMPLKALVGDREVLEIEATDDKMVKKALIYYTLPGQKREKTGKLKLVKGDNKKGIWRFTTPEFDDDGKFKFFIKVEDSTGQDYTTKKYSIKVVEED